MVNLEYILAIELFYALQAIDFRRPNRSSDILESIHSHLRQIVAFTTEDRIFSQDIHALHDLIHTGQLIEFINEKAMEMGVDLN
jgi:histidine ammonia-lyase